MAHKVYFGHEIIQAIETVFTVWKQVKCKFLEFLKEILQLFGFGIDGEPQKCKEFGRLPAREVTFVYTYLVSTIVLFQGACILGIGIQDFSLFVWHKTRGYFKTEFTPDLSI